MDWESFFWVKPLLFGLLVVALIVVIVFEGCLYAITYGYDTVLVVGDVPLVETGMHGLGQGEKLQKQPDMTTAFEYVSDHHGLNEYIRVICVAPYVAVSVYRVDEFLQKDPLYCTSAVILIPPYR